MGRTLKINGWYGRFGNNIVTLLNGVVYGLQNGYDVLKFEKHDMFNSDHIVLTSMIEGGREDCVSSVDVYFLRSADKIKYHLSEREIFDRYISGIIKTIDKETDIQVVLYVRGEDLFTEKIVGYPQPPLYFYKKVMELEGIDQVLMVSKDLHNPVASHMYHNNICLWQEQDFAEDIHLLLNCKSLTIAYSTLLIFVILCSKKLETIYVPSFVNDMYYDQYKFSIKDLLKPEQKMVIIDIPNYFRIPTYTPEEFALMISYTP
jgi:hypothetical protein